MLKSVEFYDSRGGKGRLYLKQIKALLRSQGEDVTTWSFTHVETPQQLNDDDCGVFLLALTFYLLMGCRGSFLATAFSQSQCNLIRQRVALFILSMDDAAPQAEKDPALLLSPGSSRGGSSSDVNVDSPTGVEGIGGEVGK